MDELKYLTNKDNIQQITVALQKLCKSIRAEKEQNIKESQIKEIDFLRELCSSEHTNLSLLAHQAFVRLVEDGILEAANCLAMFIAMLPSAKYNQHTAITEGVIDLLLLDLKRRSILLKSSESYSCPFGIKAPQHPIIMLIQRNESNFNDLTNKINGICNHHDKEIRRHSIEFLRPVFLYILCNPVIIPDSNTIWSCLLSHTKKSNEAQTLVDEILCWSKTCSATTTLKTSLLLSEAVNTMLHNNNQSALIQFAIYLNAVLNDLLTYGYDPRPGFRIILKVISELSQVDSLTWDWFLILLAQSLHNVSPLYLPDVVRLLKFIIVKQGGGRLTRLMILDGLIIWIANSTLLSPDVLHDVKELLDFIINSHDVYSSKLKSTSSFNMKFCHPSVAIAFHLAVLSQRIDAGLCDGNTKQLDDFIASIQAPSQIRFSNHIHLFLRGIFLNNKTPSHSWMKVLEVLLKIVESNQDVAIGLILPLLFQLSRETVPNAQLEILRGLTQFAVIKENIPTILNTLNSLTSGALRPLSMDLYLRLWKRENRTYPFLHKLLHESYEKDKNSFELNVAKAFTIKEICKLKPTQHGTDLVVHLSNILNQSCGSRGETPTTIAMEAIIILCESHTINIASTWKALSHKFNNEKRKRPLIRLCQFFGQVPLLRSPTMEYEKLHAEVITKLWHYIVYSDRGEIISASLTALRNFDFNEFTLAQIPDLFRQNIPLPSEYTKTPIDAARDIAEVVTYVPGQCWVQLIQKVNHSAIEAAADLVSHYIYNEIDAYRSGVYQLPEGKPERTNLKQLHNRSPLRFVVEYLMSEAKKSIKGNELIVLNCLRCLSKKYPKPIPPLDMFFLLSFMNEDVEMRKYCVRILSNQVLQSGTSKNLLENYLIEFDEERCLDFGEVEVILDVMIDLINGVSTEILKNFLKMLFDYAFKQYHIEPLIFEKLLESIKPVFSEKCRNEDAANMVSDIVESYFMSIDLNSKMFQKYIEVCGYLPSSVLDTMSSPNTWWDVTSEKFQKATLIRCHLASKSNRLENSLVWLNPIVDNVTKNGIEPTFVLRNISHVLHRYENDKNISNWTMEIQGKVQATLLEKTANSSTNSEFLMDLFMMCIVISSGYSTLLGNIDMIASCRQNRLDAFPGALYLLSGRNHWKDCIVRIFEFLYHIFMNTNLRSCYTEAAKNALICTKNDFYFTEKTNWMKYIGMRRERCSPAMMPSSLRIPIVESQTYFLWIHKSNSQPTHPSICQHFYNTPRAKGAYLNS